MADELSTPPAADVAGTDNAAKAPAAEEGACAATP